MNQPQGTGGLAIGRQHRYVKRVRATGASGMLDLDSPLLADDEGELLQSRRR